MNEDYCYDDINDDIRPTEWNPTVPVKMKRYEELIRKEVLLRQIRRMVEEEPGEYYVNREPLKKILAVLE
ncbi:MAG: hypothetical protein IJT62_04175 [Oscillospiraceae bacterium]|nr:hypothetical protein [Oscillospiraceae bacterium]